MGRRPASSRPRLRAAILVSALAAGCAGSGETPRPSAGIPGGQPQDSPLALEPTGSLEAPTPPALVPQAAAVQVDPTGGLAGESGQPAPVASVPAAQVAAASPSVTPGATTVTLSPLVGLPDSAASNLSRALAARAPAYGLQLVSPGAAPGALTVRGYLAAVPAEGGAAAIHVWDIYDGSGRRLHRVEGSQAMRESADWADLPPSAWDGIADQAWGEIAAWLNARAG